MEDLLSFLNQIASSEGWPLSAACLAHLRKIIKTARIKEEDFLLKAGEVCTNIYFIQKGLLKCFYIVDRRKVSDWFFGELETVVSIDSFYDQLPSEDFIQALEDSELFYITFEELNYMYRTFVEFNVVGRVLTNKYLRIWHRQARNIRMLTADERYQFFLKTQPDLINRVTVRDLASHLDMSRETLSRCGEGSIRRFLRCTTISDLCRRRIRQISISLIFLQPIHFIAGFLFQLL